MDNSRIEFDAQGLAKSIVFLADRAAKVRLMEGHHTFADLSLALHSNIHSA